MYVYPPTPDPREVEWLAPSSGVWDGRGVLTYLREGLSVILFLLF